MPKLDEYLTIKDAAAYLAVSPNTLRNWGANGKIRMHRHPLNGYRLFKKSDLDELLQQVETSADKQKRKKRQPR